jgi:hypothetical protein
MLYRKTLNTLHSREGLRFEPRQGLDLFIQHSRPAVCGQRSTSFSRRFSSLQYMPPQNYAYHPSLKGHRERTRWKCQIFSTVVFEESWVPSTQEKPWWCSGQHTRPGILRSYSLPTRLPKFLKLSLEDREVAGSNPAHGALYLFWACVAHFFDAVVSEARMKFLVLCILV